MTTKKYQNIQFPCGDVPADTLEENAQLLEVWADHIFETWRPHRNESDGGAIFMILTSKTHGRFAWCPYEKFADILKRSDQFKPPCDKPANEVHAGTTGVAGDVAWLLIEFPDSNAVRVIAIQWPFEVEVADTSTFTKGGNA